MPLDQEAVAVPVGRSAIAADFGDAQPSSASLRGGLMSTDQVSPPVDIYEGPDGLILEADMPGVPDQNVAIQVEENVLTLQGLVTSHPPDGSRVLHEEYRSGDFARSFILSAEVDRGRISASLRNGVLRITLPKAERTPTRKIEIKTP